MAVWYSRQNGLKTQQSNYYYSHAIQNKYIFKAFRYSGKLSALRPYMQELLDAMCEEREESGRKQ